MIVLADNDIIHKLACCDLLNELLILLESPPNKIWILPTLPFKVRKLLKQNPAALERLNNFLENTENLPSANINLLEQFSELDVGEQQLIAVFVERTDDMRIVTGDKRAIRQIAELARKNQALLQRLENNVDCLEGIMISLIKLFGFEAVNSKVIGHVVVDGVLKQAFGRHEAHALDALNSYLMSLHSEATFIRT